MLQSAFDYARHIGPIYGSEKIAFLLYSLVRIRRPDSVVELGCGTGATAFCMATALRENDHGRLLTVDNEQSWPAVSAKLPLAQLGFEPGITMTAYIAACSSRFGVEGHLTYHRSELPPFPAPKDKLGFLFVDYNHRPENVTRLLATYLPVMAPSSVIVFDSAATFFPTYQFLENLEHLLSQGRVPEMLLHDQSRERQEALTALVQRSRIKLMHFVEQDKAEQNSASALFIDPVDLLPSAGAVMRMG
ncbi:MAG: class I SAM-dependent methyltransferase [Alphaproteobacteria bacterium]